MVTDSQHDGRCPLCDGDDSASFPCSFENLLRCKRCSFIFADRQAFDGSDVHYEEDFAAATPHPTFVEIDGDFCVKNEYKLSRLLARLERYRKNDRILDVGCSAAFLLKLAEQKSWSPFGVETSDFANRYSRDILGIDVFEGTLKEAQFPKEHFDVVFSSHLIEHIADPMTLLTEMKRVLRIGGALVTVLPTQFSSPSYRLFKIVFGDGPPRHLSFFSKNTFERALRSIGLRIVYSRNNLELDRIRQLLLREQSAQRTGKEASNSSKGRRPQGIGAMERESIFLRA